MASSDETAAKRADNGRRSGHSEDELADQIGRLQKDISAIAATVAHLADEKVHEARSTAKHEVGNLVRSGQHAVEEVQDEFGHVEKQLKDSIRQKPLTAVIGAIALGFVLAIVTR